MCDKPQTAGLGDTLSAVVNPKMGENGFQVSFDRMLGKVQHLANAFVGQAFRQKAQYFKLSGGQGVGLHNRRLQRRIKKLTPAYPLDHAHQRTTIRRFRQKANSAGGLCSPHRGFIFATGNDHHWHRKAQLFKLCKQRQPDFTLKAQIKQHKCGLRRLSQILNGVRYRAYTGYNSGQAFFLKNGGQTKQKKGMIINNQYPGQRIVTPR